MGPLIERLRTALMAPTLEVRQTIERWRAEAGSWFAPVVPSGGEGER
ncbi:MAG: hypothetical protein HYY84_13640 [Deltaproteobacteria bacterium]|nr:hypothetical protein [Deltaproteobacteria bacterium]